jgi:hypothetical protein
MRFLSRPRRDSLTSHDHESRSLREGLGRWRDASRHCPPAAAPCRADAGAVRARAVAGCGAAPAAAARARHPRPRDAGALGARRLRRCGCSPRNKGSTPPAMTCAARPAAPSLLRPPCAPPYRTNARANAGRSRGCPGLARPGARGRAAARGRSARVGRRERAAAAEHVRGHGGDCLPDRARRQPRAGRGARGAGRAAATRRGGGGGGRSGARGGGRGGGAAGWRAGARLPLCAARLRPVRSLQRLSRVSPSSAPLTARPARRSRGAIYGRPRSRPRSARASPPLCPALQRRHAPCPCAPAPLWTRLCGALRAAAERFFGRSVSGRTRGARAGSARATAGGGCPRRRAAAAAGEGRGGAGWCWRFWGGSTAR